jgi:hypothetical protein
VSAVNGDELGDLNWQTPDSALTVLETAVIQAKVNGTVGVNSVPTDILFHTTTTATLLERLRIPSDGSIQMPTSTAAVSDANTGRLRYNTTGQKFQISANGAAYVDLAASIVERLSVDGAASITADVTYVSGAGTDLTLANGTVDGFVKKFVVTGGTGTITPANLADGNVLTYLASPASVLLIWDATAVTWHVLGTPFNMITT